MKPKTIYPLPDLGFFGSLLAVIKGYRVPNRRTTKEVLEIINNNPKLKALAEKDNSEKRKQWINYARLPASKLRRVSKPSADVNPSTQHIEQSERLPQLEN